MPDGNRGIALTAAESMYHSIAMKGYSAIEISAITGRKVITVQKALISVREKLHAIENLKSLKDTGDGTLLRLR